MSARRALLFEVGHPTRLSNDKGVKLRVAALLGGKQFDVFFIDLVSHRRELVGQVERQQIPRMVDTPDFPQETTVQIYPLADQIADKICAMYERHNDIESTRYRDLVDLLLISNFLTIDLASTAVAIECERELRRIPSLPATLESPGLTWPSKWAEVARLSPLPDEQHDFETALTAASRCYSRILGSLNVVGREAAWNHERGVWESRQSGTTPHHSTPL